MRIERREMAARARRDPSAERRELERLRKMADRQSVRLELRVERRAVHPGLDPRCARNFVNFENFVEMHEIYRDRPAITIVVGRLDSSDYARSAAVRYRNQPRTIAPFEDPNQIMFITRERDYVDWVWVVASECAADIAG